MCAIIARIRRRVHRHHAHRLRGDVLPRWVCLLHRVSPLHWVYLSHLACLFRRAGLDLRVALAHQACLAHRGLALPAHGRRAPGP